jgi:butyrate kinase
MSYHILAINPGSTSTKLAIYEDEKLIYKESVKHDAIEISKFEHINYQYDFRMKAIH